MSQIARTVHTPIGGLVIVAEAAELLYVLHEKANAAILVAMRAVQVPIDCPEKEGINTHVLSDAQAQLNEYFAGTRHEFDLPLSNSGTLFQRRIWQAMMMVPFGQTITYRELARKSGHPQAERAAGSACGANPLPIIVPCHRITRTDGSIGQYALGEEVKATLLQHESVKVRQFV